MSTLINTNDLRPQALVLEQGTPEWHDFRALGIGGSDAAILMGANPWETVTNLYKAKAGIVTRDPFEMNDAMKHGVELEPIARKAFMTATGLKVEPKCFIHPQYPWMRASLDGITSDGRIILEIKCPTKLAIHMKVVRGTIPSYYYPQLQHQLAVCNADVVCFWSFTRSSGGFMLEVEPDPKYIKELIKREKLFWEHVDHKIEPDVDAFKPFLIP